MDTAETATVENPRPFKDPDLFQVAPQVWGLKVLFVNVYFVQNETTREWVLIDAGLPGSAGKIMRAAEEIFGQDARPACIVMTHGHFDHRGALGAFMELWNVPVYCHTLEEPYLNGASSYPPPDPTVGGGMMAYLSFAYPKNPIDISSHLQPLPDNGAVPSLPGWRWIHSPGHSPGHVSLFRDTDRILIVGDAFVTTKQESAIAALKQPEVLSGPPKYFTTDWQQAQASVEALSLLQPEVVATGHGKPMSGRDMQTRLAELARDFVQEAVPPEGRYTKEPAQANEHGTTYVPPLNKGPVIKLASVAALAAVALFGVSRKVRRPRSTA